MTGTSVSRFYYRLYRNRFFEFGGVVTRIAGSSNSASDGPNTVRFTLDLNYVFPFRVYSNNIISIVNSTGPGFTSVTPQGMTIDSGGSTIVVFSAYHATGVLTGQAYSSTFVGTGSIA